MTQICRRYLGKLRFSFLALAVLLPLSGAAADSWSAPSRVEIQSDSGHYRASIAPGKGEGASAATFARQADGNYRQVARFTLQNKAAPVEVLLTDAGTLVALDNWHAFGFGVVVGIYDNSGGLVVGYLLEDLYSSAQIDEITRSISSRWWRCGRALLQDDGAQSLLVIHESLGGKLIFDLSSGEYQRLPGSGGC